MNTPLPNLPPPRQALPPPPSPVQPLLPPAPSGQPRLLLPPPNAPNEQALQLSAKEDEWARRYQEALDNIVSRNERQLEAFLPLNPSGIDHVRRAYHQQFV